MSDAQSPLGFIATFESTHSAFEAHGTTEAQASAALFLAIGEHAAQTGMHADWWQHYAEPAVRPFSPGAAFRDGQQIAWAR